MKQCAHQFLRVFYTHTANMNNHLLKPEHTHIQYKEIKHLARATSMRKNYKDVLGVFCVGNDSFGKKWLTPLPC